MLTEERIRKRITELEAERTRLVEAANARLAQIGGQLEAWNEMLAMMESEEGEAEDGKRKLE